MPQRRPIWRTQTVSQYYGLGADQGALEFVDVDVVADTRLFVDPRALRILAQTDQWAHACCELLRDFFGCLLEAVHEDDESQGLELLEGLREPNDTRLGFSGRRAEGNAIGPVLRRNIWQKLRSSEAAQTGLLEDLEDSALMIPRIATDRISDMTINVIRAPLIAFTQEMCEQHSKIGTERVPAGLIWDDEDHVWLSSEREELPVPEGRPLLLLPKSILRARLDFDPGDYYSHVINWLRYWELERPNSELVELLKNGRHRVTKKRVIAKYRRKYGRELSVAPDESLSRKDFSARATIEHPGILSSYKEDKNRPSRRPSPPTYSEVAALTGGEPPDLKKLLRDVTSVKRGKSGADSYHAAVHNLLDVLFWPELQFGEAEVKVQGGRKRLDIRYVNTREGSGFFSWIAQHYGDAPHVVVECKNYRGDPGNPELDQLLGRFTTLNGKVGILACRGFKSKDLFIQRCKEAAKGGQGFVIPLDDRDLGLLVSARLEDNAEAFKSPLFERFHEVTD